MKNIKKLTYNERLIVASWGLDPKKWGRLKLVDGCMILFNYDTAELREIPARVKSREV